MIAEYVWLFEDTSAAQRILVFGNDRWVPEVWLKDYGDLLKAVDFYVTDEPVALEKLKVR